MIKNIKISKFKSIKEEVVLNFDDTFSFNVLFGKTATGKTTIFEAVKVFKEVFLLGMRSIDRIPNETETTYTFEFIIDKQLLVYQATLSYDKSDILYESLAHVTKTSNHVYFTRSLYDITIGEKMEKLFTPFDFERFKTYLYDLRFDRREFILNHLRLKDFSDSKSAHILIKLSDYMKKLKFFKPNDSINFYTDMKDSHYVSVLKLVQSVMPHMHSFQYKDISLDDLRYDLNRHRYDHLIDEFRNQVTKSNTTNFFVEVYDKFYKLSGRSLNELTISTIDVHYTDGKIIPFNELSKGEKKFLMLSMLISNSNIHDYIFIDDITNFLDHESFLVWLNKVKRILGFKNIKLSCSVQDMLLFDSAHFDFKEMIYVTKRIFTKLHYIDTIGIRKDKKLLNLYLDGYFNDL